MTDRATSQSDNFVPPRRGKVVSIVVDTTARPYNLTTAAMADFFNPNGGWQDKEDYVYLTLQADGAACYVYFHTATASDLDETAGVSAGSAITLANTHGAVVEDGQSMSFRINRKVDKWLIVKGSGAGKLRFWASSQRTGM